MNTLLFLLLGLIIGSLLGWLWQRNRGQTEMNRLREQLAQEEQGQSSLHARLEDRESALLEQKEKIGQQEQELLRLNKLLAQWETENKNLQQQIDNFEQKSKEQAEQLLTQFQNLSNKILEQNSKKFSDQNKDQLDQLLSPLKERLGEFQKRVEESHTAGEKRSASFSEQIKALKEMNLQITQDAKNLTKALRGDSKTQGNWGEMQVERILERSGLQKGTHYRREKSLQNEDGAHQRLDFIIDLPDGKNLILDSKVSLSAYAKYFEAEEEEDKARFLKQHIDSLYAHMKGLSDKNYQKLYDINAPDYVMMYVANEPALTLALREDPNLYDKALDKNLVLVSTTTLLATMRTISYIWNQDAQNRNAEEIARQAAGLYDKFANFSEDLIKLGRQMKTASGTYEDAMNKLSEGKDNLIRKTERLRDLGIDPSKQLNQKLLDRSADD